MLDEKKKISLNRRPRHSFNSTSPCHHRPQDQNAPTDFTALPYTRITTNLITVGLDGRFKHWDDFGRFVCSAWQKEYTSSWSVLEDVFPSRLQTIIELVRASPKLSLVKILVAMLRSCASGLVGTRENSRETLRSFM